MNGRDLLTDPAFLDALSPDEQSFVAHTLFTEPGEVLKRMNAQSKGEALNCTTPEKTTSMMTGYPMMTPKATTPQNCMHGAMLHQESMRGPPHSPYGSQVYSHTSHDSSTPTPSFSTTPAKCSSMFVRTASEVYVCADSGVCDHKERPAALSAALDRLTSSLTSDGTLPLSTFEKIVKELSGIECLQAMMLFRPNKKKGKGGRQPAKDPRLDPNMDPRKAKRIVANRQSAARSKQKQKRHVESLQLQHDTLMIQMLLCGREKEKLEQDIDAIERDVKMLDSELQALMAHVHHMGRYLCSLTKEKDALKGEVSEAKPREK